MSKQCSRCGEMKDDFPHKRTYCRQCGNEMCRDYKRRNKEKIAAYNKNYKEEHREEISEYNHLYNKENREAIQMRQTKTQRERVKKDENFKLARKYRGILQDHVKKGFEIKDERSIEIYSCESELIQLWFENLFTDEMSWENHGTLWHVDHIKPCCMFNLTNSDELKECFHWSNLRPSFIIENQRKNNKFDEQLIEEYKLISNQFLEEYNEN
jgi:hypothetical protein